MDAKLFEDWNTYSQTKMAAAKQLETLNTQLVEKLTSKQMEFANAAFEAGSRYTSMLVESKDFQSFAAVQTQATSEFGESLMESARSSANILSGAQAEYQAWFDKSLSAFTNGVDLVVPGVKSAAKKPSKKAA